MKMSRRGHDTLEHTADMGLRGWGESIQQAFEEIAKAMFELTADVRGLNATREVGIHCRGSDREELLIELLNNLLLRSDIDGVVFVDLDIERLDDEAGLYTVEATAHGVPMREVKDRLLIEVKAATYCGASVKEDESGMWSACCVVDV
jgi:SHS2 domain-containing protein